MVGAHRWRGASVGCRTAVGRVVDVAAGWVVLWLLSVEGVVRSKMGVGRERRVSIVVATLWWLRRDVCEGVVRMVERRWVVVVVVRKRRSTRHIRRCRQRLRDEHILQHRHLLTLRTLWEEKKAVNGQWLGFALDRMIP